MPSLSLDTSIQYIKGVGPNLASLFRKKDIYSLEDALYFLPRTYEDRQNFKPIKDLTPGQRETSFGVIKRLAFVPLRSGRSKIFELVIADKSGWIVAKWFHYNAKYMMTKFKPDMSVVFSGEVKLFKYQKEMTHPDIEIIEDTQKESLHFGRIVPVYSETEGLFQKTIRRIVKNVLDQSLAIVQDPLPEDIRKRQTLWDLKKSFSEIHFPSHADALPSLFSGQHPARRRLVFDEFFFLELGLLLKRSHVTKEKTQSFLPSQTLKSSLLASLPFELTQSQKTALLEIAHDLEKPHPMNRLLQGDVGSGKTLVALLSALSVIEQGHQVAFMVPTEILDEQHAKTFQTHLSPLGISLGLLKSDMKKNEKEIEQRLLLKKKGGSPHMLVMTATPIPRTLALTVYGDLDVSVMTELPAGRKPVKTKVLRESQRLKLYEFMTKEFLKGRQAYVVYPLIEESEKVDLKDATQMAEHLKKIFKDFRVELLHGRMTSEEKNKIMLEFKKGHIQVLVSTTVIEVGIDIPNSTIMMVEHAERFGLSQLHQLRGRVGRGSENSFCFLMAHYTSSSEAQERLKAMEEFQSGFKIAEVDLKIRGPGEFLGTRQSGLPGFRVANLMTDQPWLMQARKEAELIIERDPYLSSPENLPLKEALKSRWQNKINLMSAG
ncbi:MAG: ATP-dependent DNA helicase RecG [Deltaproteobacteria bacterium]|nr:ATP-dependent DNA helicase RecG [Deltaproteobacteria bacterium]